MPAIAAEEFTLTFDIVSRFQSELVDGLVDNPNKLTLPVGNVTTVSPLLDFTVMVLALTLTISNTALKLGRMTSILTEGLSICVRGESGSRVTLELGEDLSIPRVLNFGLDFMYYPILVAFK